METKGVKAMAREMVGDGKLPNKYFVSIGNSYMYFNKESSAFEGIGDLELFDDEQGGTKAVFGTYQEALDYIDEHFSLGMEYGGFTINSIIIEDRLTGQVFERTRLFYPAKGEIRDTTFEDTHYTKEEMEKRHAVFE